MSRLSSFGPPVYQVNPIRSIPTTRQATEIIDFRAGSKCDTGQPSSLNRISILGIMRPLIEPDGAFPTTTKPIAS